MTQPANPPLTHTPEVRINTNKPARKDDPGPNAKLPHERDQSTDMTDGQAAATRKRNAAAKKKD